VGASERLCTLEGSKVAFLLFLLFLYFLGKGWPQRPVFLLLFSLFLYWCIMVFKAGEEGRCVAVLKAIYNKTFIVDAPINDLMNVLPDGKL